MSYQAQLDSAVSTLLYENYVGAGAYKSLVPEDYSEGYPEIKFTYNSNLVGSDIRIASNDVREIFRYHGLSEDVFNITFSLDGIKMTSKTRGNESYTLSKCPLTLRVLTLILQLILEYSPNREIYDKNDNLTNEDITFSLYIALKTLEKYPRASLIRNGNKEFRLEIDYDKYSNFDNLLTNCEMFLSDASSDVNDLIDSRIVSLSGYNSETNEHNLMLLSPIIGFPDYDSYKKTSSLRNTVKSVSDGIYRLKDSIWTIDISIASDKVYEQYLKNKFRKISYLSH